MGAWTWRYLEAVDQLGDVLVLAVLRQQLVEHVDHLRGWLALAGVVRWGGGWGQGTLGRGWLAGDAVEN